MSARKTPCSLLIILCDRHQPRLPIFLDKSQQPLPLPSPLTFFPEPGRISFWVDRKLHSFMHLSKKFGKHPNPFSFTFSIISHHFSGSFATDLVEHLLTKLINQKIDFLPLEGKEHLILTLNFFIKGRKEKVNFCIKATMNIQTGHNMLS